MKLILNEREIEQAVIDYVEKHWGLSSIHRDRVTIAEAEESDEVTATIKGPGDE